MQPKITRKEWKMMKDIVVYDLLEALGPIALEHALKLFEIAGRQLTDSTAAYFFEKSARDYLSEVQKVEIFDENGNSVGNISNREEFFSAVTLGSDERFSRDRKYHMGKPSITPEEEDKLSKIYENLHNQLYQRGKVAAKEFRLFAEMVTGKSFNTEEAESDMSKIIKGIYKGFKK